MKRMLRWAIPVVAAASMTASLSWSQVTRPGGSGAGSGTRPAAASAANRAAALDHFNKAKALNDQNHLAEAMAENDQALLLDPNLDVALLLRRILRTKMDEGAGLETGGGGTGSTLPGAGGKPRLLTPAQVSLIRLMETSPDDRVLRGSVPRRALMEFWDTVIKKLPGEDLSPQASQNFLNPTNFVNQVQRIKDSGNTKFMEQVIIMSDPMSMVSFHNMVHTFVLQNCATAECHGGDKGGDFRLIGGSTNDQTIYTNFYIMAMYTGKDGGKMIDRNNPDKSLFLQYALPKAAAELPHPGKDITRRLTAKNDQRFVAMSAWVQKLALPRPNYGITYELPGGAHAVADTRPATAPATRGR